MGGYRSGRRISGMLLCLWVAVMASGCGGADDRPEPPSKPAPEPASPSDPAEDPTSGAPATATASASCTHEQQHEVEYPEEWHEHECRYFDPEPITVEEGTDATPAVIALAVEQRSPEAVLDEFTQARYGRLLSRGEFSMNGQTTWSAEVEASGAGLHPKGMRLFVAAVELDKGTTIVARVFELPGRDYEQAKPVAEAMVASAS